MRRISCLSLAAASWLVAEALLSVLCAATRPRYSGGLRVEMRAQVASLDPREMSSDGAEAAATQRLAALVFERLVRLDDNGRPLPALAVAWQHDAEAKRWQFRLRPGVKFHDGTPLTAERAAAALQPLLGNDRLVSVSGEWLLIQSAQPVLDLLEELAGGRNFIFQLTSDGIAGTGAFRIAQWQPRRRLVLAANEDCWAGRPFLDSITVEMGVAAPQQLIDLELGKADLVELSPDQVRRAVRAGSRTWSSAPVELLALVFDPHRPAVEDARVRQAMALAMDRASMVSVLLQKQAEAAGGLLPQWLSGYAFLFSTAADSERAKQLRGELSPAAPLVLVYDSGDLLARSVAERVAVNAREAGIAVQVSGRGLAAASANAAGNADLRLARLRLASPDPRRALASLWAALGEAAALPGGAATPEQLYAAERALLETYRVVPLVHLPETYGLGPRVKNWMPRSWGGWRLDEVWLDVASQAAAGGNKP